MKASDVLLGLLGLMRYQAIESQLDCVWKEGRGQLISALEDNLEKLSAPDAETCQRKCLRQTTFICTGYNYMYRPPNNASGIAQNTSCELLAENRDRVRVVQVPNFTYGLRPLCSGIWLPWLERRGFRSGLLARYDNNSLAKCKRKCHRYSENGRICRLIERMKDKVVCNLYETRLEYGSFTSQDDTIYFERPAWYLDSSTAITKQSERLYWRHIEINNIKHRFHKTEVVVSGYLVGWKFLGNQLENSKFCETKLTVVREITPNNYTIIAEHMLKGGYKYKRQRPTQVELIHSDKEYIRLKKGDMLTSMAIRRTRRTNCAELIKDELVPELVLIAFVSEYLSMESPPLVYYNSSLNRSQAWLTIPAPPARDDNSVIYGYKIICAEDRELLKRFSCNLYDEVVPVTQKQVLLTFSKEIGTIFISLQVCRNFKGKELLDHAFSPVTMFCPNISVDIRQLSIEEISRTNKKVDLSVEFSLHLKNGKACVEGIKLNVTGFEGKYIAANSTKYTYSLALSQGATYTFLVYAKRNDGLEIRAHSFKFSVSEGIIDSFLWGAAIGILMALLIILVATSLIRSALRDPPRPPSREKREEQKSESIATSWR